MEKRIGAALSAAGAVRSQVLESRDLSKSAKMLVYKTMIETTLTYSAESWVLKEREKQSSSSRDESAKEDSRSEESRSCEK